MGLGKTVQAIAACALLRRLRGIERVLVVSPASVKAEWEEQIARFSELPACVVAGDRLARRAAYRSRTFFTLCNYEQILVDGDEILDLLEPEVVILDEAQRIKNWQTKTANAVKRLHSRYAFVLTGTPLENRIDEIYSIVEFLDPELLGSLFRFNREYYELDAKGRPVGFRNLEQLADRIGPVMLRRRKEEVESQLPGRTTKTFFVPMTDTQQAVYEDYEFGVRRLAAIARRRPLIKEEYERLQKFLACMRMVCDTPAILDGQRHECPKLDEIERLLPELLSDPQRKILIFSEWIRMLELVREHAVAAGVEFAWHTGSVPQIRRRAEIRRFREDPECRLFLSTESGGVGLNLQAADTVINMDQPWNPARLEQRVARAWRKHRAQRNHLDAGGRDAGDSSRPRRGTGARGVRGSGTHPRRPGTPQAQGRSVARRRRLRGGGAGAGAGGRAPRGRRPCRGARRAGAGRRRSGGSVPAARRPGGVTSRSAARDDTHPVRWSACSRGREESR